MGVTTGAAGSSATPATDLYNLLAAAMTAAGTWTEQSDSPVSAANAATTDIVRVWKCTGGAANFYVFIEVDNTNLRLRIRLSEYWDTTGHKLRQPAGGGTVAPSADATSVTPTANGTVTDADATIGSTNPLVSYVEAKVLGTAYNYLYEARNNLLTVATKVSGTNYYAIAGCFTTLVQALSDTAPLVLLGHPVNMGMSGTAGSSSNGNNGRFTRLPGFGAVAVTGAFCCSAMPLLMAGCNNIGSGGTTNMFSSVGGVASNPWFSNHLVGPCIVHGMGSGTVADRRGLRGYLPNFVAGYFTTEPSITDTIVVGGVTYYPLGRCCWNLAASANGGYLAIKG